MLLENLVSNSGLTISNGKELAKLNQSSQKYHSELCYKVGKAILSWATRLSQALLSILLLTTKQPF